MRNCRCFFDIFSLFFSLERLEYAANVCFVDFFECKVPAKLVFSFVKTTFCQLWLEWKAGDWTNVYAEIVKGTKKLRGIKGKLLRYFRYSALITYIIKLLSASISMLSIYSFVKQKRRCCKTRFATPPFMLEVQIALEREQDYFLSQLFLSPQPCSPQQPFFSLHSFLQSFMQPFLQDFLSSFLQHFLSSFLQHFLLSFLQQVSFLSACFTSCAAALRPKARRAANARHLAAAFTLNSFMLSVFYGWMNVTCQINLFYSGKSIFFF